MRLSSDPLQPVRTQEKNAAICTLDSLFSCPQVHRNESRETNPGFCCSFRIDTNYATATVSNVHVVGIYTKATAEFLVPLPR